MLSSIFRYFIELVTSNLNRTSCSQASHDVLYEAPDDEAHGQTRTSECRFAQPDRSCSIFVLSSFLLKDKKMGRKTESRFLHSAFLYVYRVRISVAMTQGDSVSSVASSGGPQHCAR